MKLVKTLLLVMLLTSSAVFASADMPEDSRRRGGRDCDARYCEDDRRDTEEPIHDEDNRGPDDDSDPDFDDRDDGHSDLFEAEKNLWSFDQSVVFEFIKSMELAE